MRPDWVANLDEKIESIEAANCCGSAITGGTITAGGRSGDCRRYNELGDCGPKKPREETEKGRR